MTNLETGHATSIPPALRPGARLRTVGSREGDLRVVDRRPRDMALGACRNGHRPGSSSCNTLSAQDGLSGSPLRQTHHANSTPHSDAQQDRSAWTHCNASRDDPNGNFIDGPARLVAFNDQLQVASAVRANSAETR